MQGFWSALSLALREVSLAKEKKTSKITELECEILFQKEIF